MGLARWLLMIAGFGLMGSGGALLTYDIYLAEQLRKLLRGDGANRKPGTGMSQELVRRSTRSDWNGIRRPKTLRVARYASLESGNPWRKATGASLLNPKASTAALDRLSPEKAEAIGGQGFLPSQRRVPCHPASGA